MGTLLWTPGRRNVATSYRACMMGTLLSSALLLFFLLESSATTGGRTMQWLSRREGHLHLPLHHHPGNHSARLGGQLFSWGLGSDHRLGRDGDSALPLPALEHLAIVDVAGSAHTILATQEGHVYTMGRNSSDGGGGGGSEPIPDSGQLGRGGGQAPARVLGLLEGEQVVSVKAGRYHSVALTAAGRVFTWGLNDFAQLGREGSRSGSGSPCSGGAGCWDGSPGLVVGLPEEARVAAISAGRYWSLAAVEDGRLFTWGYDGCGSDGRLPIRLHEPRLMGGSLEGCHVVAMDSGYVQWVALTADGQAHSCNTQDDGYAGMLPGKRAGNDAGELGREGDPFQPGRVLGALEGKRVVAVAAGRDFCVAADEDGSVYSWGHGGQMLGRGPGTSTREPGLVGGALAGLRVHSLAAGEYFSLAATNDSVFAWGTNNYATLGIGAASSEPQGEPQRVRGPLSQAGRWRIATVAAGYQHALAIARREDAGEDLEFGTAGGGAGGGAPGVELAAESAAEAVDHTSYLEAQVSAPQETPAEIWAAWKPGPARAELEKLSPDVFRALPAQLTPGLQNPCWNDTGRGGLRCLPFFQILGVSKSGTTDLYARLARHPDVVEASNKGPHFWDECVWPPRDACTVPPSGDFEGYLGLFDRAAEAISSNPAAITGEASSNTYTAARGVYLRGPVWDQPLGVTISDLLREAGPYQRLIVLFRDPVERYFSAFRYYRDRSKPAPSPEEFHERAVAELQEWRGCVESNSHAHCVRHYRPQQLVKGMYAEFLEDWLSKWPREQLLFLRFEDYKETVEEHLAAVFRFLGLRPLDAAEHAAIAAAEAKNVHGSRGPGMLPETRRLLREFYRPHNQALAAVLGDSRYLWPESEAASGS